MTLEPFGWIVSLQSWTGYRRGCGLPPPPITTERFVDRAEAEARKEALRRRHPDVNAVLICVTPTPQRRSKRRR
jgi:hypothetical protein